MSGQSEQIFDKPKQNKTNLADQRLLTFGGFMRFRKVSRLRGSDFVFSSTYVRVFIEKIKKDIYREVMWVLHPSF